MDSSIPSTTPMSDPLRIDVFTVFPSLISNFTGESLLGKAQEHDLVEINAHDLRKEAVGRHKSVEIGRAHV